MSAILFAALVGASGAVTATAAADACALPPTMQIFLNSSCASLAPLAQKSVDLAGMAGEKESTQILVRIPPSSPPMVIAKVNVIGLAPAVVSVRQVAYVNTSATTRYPNSGGGWRPDPLLPLDTKGTLLEPGVATPLWLTVALPNILLRRAPITGAVELELKPAATSAKEKEDDAEDLKLHLDVTLTVWENLTLPSAVELHKDFGEIWSFDEGDLQTMYGSSYTNQTLDRFREMNTDALLPPDWLYKSHPYQDLSYYDYLRKSGAYLLNIADIGTDKRGCPEGYTPAMIEAKLASIQTAIEAIGNHPDVKPYVYGYDEQPKECEQNIRKLYGAVKAKWPHVATAAVLNWKGGLPSDLPVDIWIVQYEDYNATQAKRWQNIQGKQLFGYHCIEPSKAAFLNTFIERPRTQGRQLYWLASLYGMDGWLYYATDLWRPKPGTTHTPIQRIHRSPRTDFDPSNYIWRPRTDIFANGDGQFVYPGLDPTDGTPAPVASARLELQRDAVEDAYLLRLARRTLGEAQTNSFIIKLVRSPTDHTDDPVLLEATRREVAAALIKHFRDAAKGGLHH